MFGLSLEWTKIKAKSLTGKQYSKDMKKLPKTISPIPIFKTLLSTSIAYVFCLELYSGLESHECHASFGTKISGSHIVSPVLWVLSSRIHSFRHGLVPNTLIDINIAYLVWKLGNVKWCVRNVRILPNLGGNMGRVCYQRGNLIWQDTNTHTHTLQLMDWIGQFSEKCDDYQQYAQGIYCHCINILN